MSDEVNEQSGLTDSQIAGLFYDNRALQELFLARAIAQEFEAMLGDILAKAQALMSKTPRAILTTDPVALKMIQDAQAALGFVEQTRATWLSEHAPKLNTAWRPVA